MTTTNGRKLLARGAALSVLMVIGCDDGRVGDPFADEETSIGETTQAVTCDPTVTVYPVRGRHNHGYDSTAGDSSQWTCDAAHSNEDFIAGDHIGNDIWAAEGTPVAATTDGTATLVGFSSGSGNKVTIIDRCGWYHFFTHMQRIEPGIANGVRITAGQIIGYVGKTGTLSNGVVHLHVSIYPDGNYNAGIDPHPFHRAVESNVCGAVGGPPARAIPAFRRRLGVDVNGDRIGDVCGRASDGVHCAALDAGGSMSELLGPPWSDASGWDQPQYGFTIQMADVDGDGKADVCGRAAAGISCYLADGAGFPTQVAGPAWSDASGWDDPQYYSTIQFPDVDGDGKADVCGRAAAGITCSVSDGNGFPTAVTGPAWSNDNGWGDPKYYSTIQFPDVNGDGKADVCGRAGDGIHCSISDGSGFPTAVVGPAFTDASNWGEPRYYETIQFPDIDGDGKADVCGRGGAGVSCFLSDGSGFPASVAGPAWSNDNGWDHPRYYSTIQFADIDGDGKADVCARASDGIRCVRFDGTSFATEVRGPEWSNGNAWGDPRYYSTIQFADINSDGKADVCGRGAVGIHCALSDGNGFPTPLNGPAWSNDSGWGDPKHYSTIQFLGAPASAEPTPPGDDETPGEDGDDGPSDPGDSDGELSGGGGCSLDSGPVGGATWPFLLGAFAFVLARRRRR
jgi:hypothetical protein